VYLVVVDIAECDEIFFRVGAALAVVDLVMQLQVPWVRRPPQRIIPSASKSLASVSIAFKYRDTDALWNASVVRWKLPIFLEHIYANR
jgi:hypothetical protein